MRSSRPEQMPEGMPSATLYRNLMVQNLGYENVQAVCAWLGLTSIEMQSDEVFQLGKSLSVVAESMYGGLSDLGSDRTQSEDKA